MAVGASQKRWSCDFPDFPSHFLGGLAVGLIDPADLFSRAMGGSKSALRQLEAVAVADPKAREFLQAVKAKQAGSGLAQRSQKRTSQKESEIQAEVISWLKSQGFQAYPMFTGSKRGGVVFMPDGLPDLLVIRDGRPFFIEMKRPGEKLRPEQEAWHQNWQAYGGIVFTATHIVEVESGLRKHGLL